MRGGRLLRAGLFAMATTILVNAEGRSAGTAGTQTDIAHPESWATAPPLLDLFEEKYLLSTFDKTPFAVLAKGVPQVPASGRPGDSAAEWINHPYFPTIHSTDVPKDWTSFTSLEMDIYSVAATGERIVVAVLDDNAATFSRDYWHVAMEVNWVGWRHIVLPLAEFSPLGLAEDCKPNGWTNVSGLYLFTKSFGWEPHPDTKLQLTNVRISKEVPPITPDHFPATGKHTIGGIEVIGQSVLPDLRWLNHSSEEIRDEAPSTFLYKPYFKAERALRGYFPRYEPGYVSFTPDGRPLILAGGYLIQMRDSSGRWQTVDLLEKAVIPYVRDQLGYSKVRVWDLGQSNEAAVRFESDGDAYALVSFDNPDIGWTSRKCLLLHSRDNLQTWKAYPMPYYWARFEKMTGHNRDALNRPPVILLTENSGTPRVKSFFLALEKRIDGNLNTPFSLVKIGTDNTIGFIPHSGEANQAVSVGEMIFIAYGELTKDDNGLGVPTYVVSYDRKTRVLSPPTFIGYGGRDSRDNHNWPSIAVDSRGVLHVVINGHHNPFVYTRTTNPVDISEWTEPITVAEGTSYLGLVIGPDDTLYSVSRCSISNDSYPWSSYRFKQKLHRKRPGQAWEHINIVDPFRSYYLNWLHKLTIDPITGQLFLGYVSQSALMQIFRDDFETFVYIHPDLESSLQKQSVPSGGTVPELPIGTSISPSGERMYKMYSVPGGERTVLTSDDQGSTWRMALTDDFVGSGASSDITPPSVSLNGVSSGTMFTSPQILSVMADAKDNVGVTKVWFIRNGVVVSTDTVSPYEYSWSIAGTDNGVHNWTAKAFDAIGNGATTAPVPVTVNIDVTLPSVAITTPTTGSVFNVPETIVVKANVSDNVAVTKVWFLRNGVVVSTDTTAPYEHAWAVGEPDNGVHVWTARAFDAAGNEATSVGRTVTVDIRNLPKGVEGGRAYPVPYRANSGAPGMTFDRLPEGTRIRIFAMDGRLVRTLRTDGFGTVVWGLDSDDGGSVASGVYVVEFEGNGSRKRTRVIIQK